MEEADSLLCFVQNYGPLLTAGAILFSALIAICAILYNIKVARRRATIDLVLHEKFNPTLGAFDELIYKHVQFSVVMRDWGECEGFVRELRKSRNRPTLFQEVQWLAEKWKKKPLERYF